MEDTQKIVIGELVYFAAGPCMWIPVSVHPNYDRYYMQIAIYEREWLLDALSVGIGDDDFRIDVDK